MFKFETGKTYSCCALYGGNYAITVTDRAEKTISFIYNGEPTDDKSVQTANIIIQSLCIYDHEFNIIDMIEVETVVAWNYQPRNEYGEPLGDIEYGYYFAARFDNKLWTIEEWKDFKKEEEIKR